MNLSSHKPIRVLHVVGGMNRGGVETWLMHILRRIDRDRFQLDFLVETEQHCPYDDEVLALGSRIIPCLHPSKPQLYARNFRRMMREFGTYDVIHSHIHHYSGVVLRLAKQIGIPTRIAHSHSDTAAVKARSSFARQLYLRLTEHWIQSYATLGLACSEAAARDLYGIHWKQDHRWQVLPCGIDFSSWNAVSNHTEILTQLGIPKDAFVVGHVGRFVEEKNHAFLVKIAIELVKHEPKAHFLLIGDGALRPAIEQQVLQAGLERHFTFAGLRSNIAELMQNAMDVFLFPSRYEGLGLVLIEAQASGLPCVISQQIPQEAEIIPSFITRLSLEASAADWADCLLATRKNSLEISHTEAFLRIKNSVFNLENSLQEITRIYSNPSIVIQS